jgi:tetraacyldisaccharide 4'-kinase
MTRPTPAIEALLTPFSWLYRGVVAVKNRSFDSGTRQAQNIGTAVLSVGNITSGGTGKTPLVSLMVESLKKQNRSVGIVSRGYGGTEKGPALVPADGTTETAKRFGDEPTWLACRHQDVPVAIGGDRVKAARELSSTRFVDTIIADDGFQHRRLFRAFDIVILDASEPRWHYRPLPLGRMREPFSALGRAGAICITKTNLAETEATTWLHEQIRQNVETPPPIFEFESRLRGVAPLAASPSAQGLVPCAELAAICGASGLFLVSAIGNPDTFKQLVARDIGELVKGHLVFADHHSYTDDDKAKIASEAKASGATCILVTEKDAIKLGVDWTPELNVWVTRLETRPRTDLKELYEAIDRALL